MTTQTPAQQIASIKRTTKFKALITAGIDESVALKALGAPQPVATEPVKAKKGGKKAKRIAALVEAGFTEAEARQALELGMVPDAAPAPAEPEVDPGEALVAQHGLSFTRGRVYGGVTLAEAIVRVAKTGTPEIVKSSGVGRTAALLVNKEASGDVSVQNLRVPA